MSRLALRIAYDGASYRGWQTQPDGRAVQDIVEAALAAVAGEAVSTVCAGRTDAGVHASAQIVHFDSPVNRPLQAWVRGVNAHLPATIAMQWVTPVPRDFDARRSALRRRYTYLIERTPVRPALLSRRVGWVFGELDLAAMRDATRALIGTHDFSAFRSSHCQARSPIRDLISVDIREHSSLLEIELVANAFLHHMVRNIVGALVWIGQGRRSAAWMGELLSGADRRLGAATFAADGLYLSGVEYDSGYGLESWSARPLATLIR